MQFEGSAEQTFHNLMHHMLSQSLKLVESNRRRLNLFGNWSCTVEQETLKTFFCQFQGDNNPSSFGHTVDRRQQTEIHCCKREMTPILLSSRLQFVKNKMASERLCCSPLANIRHFCSFTLSRGLVNNSIFLCMEWMWRKMHQLDPK